MRSLSIVIPALNEAENLSAVMATIPRAELEEAGWTTEVIVVDNASTDDTAEVARSLGAIVVNQPNRGYGNAYQAGFDAATGHVIATGDADCTYPFDALPHLLHIMDARKVEFMTTNRLGRENRHAMKPSHTVANHALSALSRVLFRNGLRDSQSGMWIFQRHVWHGIEVRSPGMAFSQEIKNSATRAGFRCLEVPIEYRVRGGEVKLNALPDGVANLRQLFEHKLRDNRLVNSPSRIGAQAAVARANAAAERAAKAAERAAAMVEELTAGRILAAVPAQPTQSVLPSPRTNDDSPAPAGSRSAEGSSLGGRDESPVLAGSLTTHDSSLGFGIDDESPLEMA